MTIKDRTPVVRAFSKEYRRSRKKGKSDLLARLVTVTGYSRKHLMEILPHPLRRKRIRRKRKSPYLPILMTLKKLWAISNYACGKRLAPLIPTYLSALRRHEKWNLTKSERKLLTSVSPRTIDRLLTHEKRKLNLKGRARTKPGSLLKNQIPIRTFADWRDEERRPGFLEIDTVHHCGYDPRGDYVHTLDTSDVFTGWNECQAFMGKSEKHTIEGLETIRKRLTFEVSGLDFDTGSEFVNWHLVRYCQRNRITYTRSREEKKNDQNYIEQQNFSVVRRFVGYGRLDTDKQLRTLNYLYDLFSDYQNFFQGVMRLREKVRNGTRLTRKYDKTKTAYQRVLECPKIPKKTKEKLRKRFLKLNPRKLILEITRSGRKLSKR